MRKHALTQGLTQARKGLCFAFVAWGLLAPTVPTAQQAPQTEITLDQARSLAHQALRHNDPMLAIQLANGLLQANPDDAGALFILSQARFMAGDHKAARKASAKAYRLGLSSKERVRAAEMAARASLHEERPTLTQLWLRRAALHVEDDVAKDRIASDYAIVRQMNPFSFRLGGGVRPSNNVNNGADSALQVIDGVPLVGSLSGGAQALEGTIATFDVDLAYRLRQTETSQTRIGSRFYMRRVKLSSSAKAQAPEIDESDFDSTYLDVSLTHAFALGAKGNTASVGARLGRAWAKGDKDYDFASLSLSRSIKLGDPTRLSFAITAEERDVARNAVFDQTRLQFNASVSHKLGNGDRIGLSYAITDADSDHINYRSTAQSLRGSYAFADPVGPAKVSASVTYGDTKYPDFQIGFIEVPGGRHDKSLYGDVTFFFEDFDYGGFAPSVRLRTGKRDSNVSRYDSNEFSINFEIRSTF